MKCPDDGRPLEPGVPCRACRGFTLTGIEVAKRWPGVPLVAERRPEAAALAHPRPCPACSAVMTPMRIHTQEAWVERCAACDLLWLEHLDVAVLDRMEKRGRLEASVAARPTEDRRALAVGIAEAVATASRPMTLREKMGVIGLPTVVPEGAALVPLATTTLAVLVLLGAPAGTGFGPGVDLFRAGHDGILTALLAVPGPSGWLRALLGAYLVCAFGDGVEQQTPRWLVAGLFAVAGAVSIFVEAALVPPGSLVTGAAGAVAGLLGAAVVLRPRARVTVSLLVTRFEVPMLAFAGLAAAALGLLCLPGVTVQTILVSRPVIPVGPWAMVAGAAVGTAFGTLWRLARAPESNR